MNKKVLDKLFDIYSSTHKTNAFSKFLFARRMNRNSTINAFSKLNTLIEHINHYSSRGGISTEELGIIYLRLCDSIDEHDLKKQLSGVSKQNNDSSHDSNNQIANTLFEACGFPSDLDFNRIGNTTLIKILQQPKGVIQDLYEKYKDSIFELHLKDTDSIENFDYLPNHSVDQYSIESFYDLSSVDPETRKTLSRTITKQFGVLLSKYSIEELQHDKENIDEDIRIGLIDRLPNYDYDRTTDKRYFYSQNRSTIRSISKFFESDTLDMIERADEYFRQSQMLIMSGRFSGEELKTLQEMSECFSNLLLPYDFFSNTFRNPQQDLTNSEPVKSVFNYIVSETLGTHAASEDFIPLPERLSDLVFSYEALYRQDIVQNVTHVNPENTRTFTVESEPYNGEVNRYNIDAVLIDNIRDFGNPMVHIFDINNRISELSFYRYLSTQILETEILRGQKSDSELQTLITDVAKVLNKLSPYSPLNQNIIDERYTFENHTPYKTLSELSDLLDEDTMRAYSERYIEHISNNAEIHQVNVGSKVVVDKVNQLIDDSSIRNLFFSSDEPAISTQILRMRNAQDAKELPRNATALIFDSEGLSPEAIIISANRNIESNNYRDFSHYKTNTPAETSANLESLKNDMLMSKRVHRTNNELVLNRSAVKPSGLMFFGSRTLDYEGLKTLSAAINTAKQAELPLIFIDCDAIEQEMSLYTAKRLENKHSQEH